MPGEPWHRDGTLERMFRASSGGRNEGTSPSSFGTERTELASQTRHNGSEKRFAQLRRLRSEATADDLQ